MADKQLDAKVIKKTQDTLGKIIKKPPLTEKLLSKPPFKFLHDIMTSVIRTTGFMEGLFTDVEMDSENVKDKETKMAFLQKVIDMVSLVTGKPISAKPSKIVAGHDPDKTNELLQALAESINKKVDNADYVKRVLKSDDSKSSKKERDSSKSKDKGEESRDESRRSRDKRDESLDKDRDKGRSERHKSRDKDRPRDRSKENEEQNIERDTKSKDREERRRSREERGHGDPDLQVKDKQQGRSRNKDKERDGSRDKDRDKQRDKEKDDKDDRRNKHIDSEDRKDRHRDKESDKHRDREGDRHSKSKDREDRDGKKEKDKERRDRSKGEDEERMKNKNNDNDESADRMKAETEESLQRPSSAKGPRKRHGKDDGKEDHSEDSKLSASRKAPVRPGSARPAPPKPKRNDAPSDEVAVTSGLRRPNVIIDRDEDSDDNDFVTQEEEMLPPSTDLAPPRDRPEENGEGDGDHGGLVKKILETKKDYESTAQPAKRTEIDRTQAITDASRRKERELVQKEIDRLRSSIQTLTRSVNPLGKILDFLQEDLDAMQKELEMYQNENKENAVVLQREQSLTETALLPLKAQLQELESAIADQVDLIAAAKATIGYNDAKISKILSSMATVKS